MVLPPSRVLSLVFGPSLVVEEECLLGERVLNVVRQYSFFVRSLIQGY